MKTKIQAKNVLAMSKLSRVFHLPAPPHNNLFLVTHRSSALLQRSPSVHNPDSQTQAHPPPQKQSPSAQLMFRLTVGALLSLKNLAGPWRELV